MLCKHAVERGQVQQVDRVERDLLAGKLLDALDGLCAERRRTLGRP
jgi:hypothetical protein